MKKIIIYDFDGTLTPYPIPQFEILDKLGIKGGLTNKNFLCKIKQESINNNIDTYSALYKEVIYLFKKNNIELTDNNINIGVNNLKYNKGVEEFLNYLNNNNIKNYIISSGIQKSLENTKIAKYFDKIYATTFTYQNNIINGINYIMTDENKVEAIKDIINKNNINTNNIIYIGDGLSDYYAFEYIYNNGGTTILINNDNIIDDKLKNLSTLITNNDFSINSNIFNYILKECNLHN